MTIQVDATLINGAFQPDQLVPFPNLARVRLRVEPIADQVDTPLAA